MGLVTLLMAAAAAVQSFKDTWSGDLVEESAGECGHLVTPSRGNGNGVPSGYERIPVANPLLTDRQSAGIERSLATAIPTYGALVDQKITKAFFNVRDVMVALTDFWKDEGHSDTQMVNGLLFELSRVTHQWFASDTTADEMFLVDSQIRVLDHKGELLVDLAAEVHAFMEASLRGDLGCAMNVIDCLTAERAVTAYPDIPKDQAVRKLRLSMAAFLMVELAGTYAVQSHGDQVHDVEQRPINAALLRAEDDSDE